MSAIKKASNRVALNAIRMPNPTESSSSPPIYSVGTVSMFDCIIDISASISSEITNSKVELIGVIFFTELDF